MFGLQESKSYSGDSSYKLIDPLISERSGSLKIVSPFIGRHYAEMLIREASRKNVYVITSGSGYDSNKEAVDMLLKNRKSYPLKPALYFGLAGAASVYLKIYWLALIFLAALMIIFFISNIANKTKANNLKVKVVRDRFIHEKLYLNDNKAIVGSANLTYSGTHKNIEHIDLTSDKRRVSELSKHFDSLWSKY